MGKKFCTWEPEPPVDSSEPSSCFASTWQVVFCLQIITTGTPRSKDRFVERMANDNEPSLRSSLNDRSTAGRGA